MVRPTINSEKHIIQIGFNNASVGAVSEEILVQSLAVSPTTPRHVRVGAIVKAVYIELWVQAEAAISGTSIVILAKLPAGAAKPSVAEMLALHDYPNKKNILFTQQGLTTDIDTNAVPVMRGWYKIPKGKQRIGLGDKISLALLGQVDGMNYCGLAIYKEYY